MKNKLMFSMRDITVVCFLQDFRDELLSETYRPQRKRRKEIPKDDGKFRVLGIPCIRDRVVMAIVSNKTRVLDVDLAAYFDTVRHDLLLGNVAACVNDDQVLHLLKLILKASGTRGVPQGGVISPLLSNLYLNEVDRMLERAKDVMREGRYTHSEYTRFADDLVILVDG